MTGRTYSEMKRFRSFEERYQYLRLAGVVGESTFGFDRYLNQILYRSARWRKTRDGIIIRDNGCDLGIRDRDIGNRIIVHHINPLTPEDIELEKDEIFNPEFLVCTSENTHNAIHFGDEHLLTKMPVERRQYDTCPWRQ